MPASKTLKSGTCPRCDSIDVYTTRGIAKRGERMQLVVSSIKWFSLDTYICTNCGYYEEFINENELKDAKIINKIKDTWKKVI